MGVVPFQTKHIPLDAHCSREGLLDLLLTIGNTYNLNGFLGARLVFHEQSIKGHSKIFLLRISDSRKNGTSQKHICFLRVKLHLFVEAQLRCLSKIALCPHRTAIYSVTCYHPRAKRRFFKPALAGFWHGDLWGMPALRQKHVLLAHNDIFIQSSTPSRANDVVWH